MAIKNGNTPPKESVNYWEKIRFSETVYAIIRQYGQCTDKSLELFPHEAAIYGIAPDAYAEMAVLGFVLHYLGVHPRQ